MPQSIANKTENPVLCPSECLPASLDPTDWDSFRTQAHTMLDDILDYIKDIRDRPVWQTIPDDVRVRPGITCLWQIILNKFRPALLRPL
ncbi:MAG: hypothetical protein WBL50_05025 [Candidatus Acidiferrum sp.]